MAYSLAGKNSSRLKPLHGSAKSPIFQYTSRKIDQDPNIEFKWNRAKLPFNFPQLYPPKWGKRPNRPKLRRSRAAWDRCSGRRSDAASWDEGLAHLSGPLRAPFARQFQKTGEAGGEVAGKDQAKTHEIYKFICEKLLEPFWMCFFPVYLESYWFLHGHFLDGKNAIGHPNILLFFRRGYDGV